MAGKRNSTRRKLAPRPINTNGHLGVAGVPRQNTGSATELTFPPTSRKSSLRSAGSKTPSPDAKSVTFEDENAHSPPKRGARTIPQTPNAPRKTRAVTRTTVAKTTAKSLSPKLQFSPRTAKKVKKAIEDLIEFTDQEIPSPKPVASKINAFKGTGIQLGNNPRQHLPTPPGTPDAQDPRIRVIESAYGRTTITANKISDWLHAPEAPKTRFDEGEESIEIETKALLEMMHNLNHNLRPLSLEEIYCQFYLLQKMLRQFSKRFFNNAWSSEKTAAFNLADLPQDHAPFFRMMAYIADGSKFKAGWGDFLTSEHTRPHIVYAVLGEWLKYNVFGHSCFGLSAEEDAAMKNIDVQYLKWDGFVRTKERAKLLKKMLTTKPAWEFETDMAVAVDGVAEDLLEVLEPILPACANKRKDIESKLRTIIEIAANLHLCIRLTGIDGTILRYHSSSKGDPFAYTARQNCVNKSTVSETLNDMIKIRNNDHAPANDGGPEEFSHQKDKLVIKMPCFPLVIAVVPYGPTLKDFAVEQSLYERVIKSEDLPPNKDKGPMYIEDIPAEIVRAAHFEELPESCHKDYGHRRHDDKTRQKKVFGSYVHQYILNEADVYCEWSFQGETAHPGAGPTLRQATEAAQRAKYGYVPAERRARRRKILKTASYVAAAGMTAAVAYTVAKRTGITGAAVSVVKKLSLSPSFSMEDIKGVVGSAMANAKAKSQSVRTLFRVTKDRASAFVRGNLAGTRQRLKPLRNVAGSAVNTSEEAVLKVCELTEAAPEAIKDASNALLAVNRLSRRQRPVYSRAR